MTRLSKEREAEIRKSRAEHWVEESHRVLELLTEIDAVRAERDTLLECVRDLEKSWIELGGAVKETMLVLKIIKEQKLESNISGPLSKACYDRLNTLILDSPIIPIRQRLKDAGISYE